MSLIAVVWLGCSSSPVREDPPAPVPAPVVDALPDVEHPRKTTRPEAAVESLHAQVSGLLATPASPDRDAALFNAFALRVALLGQATDLDRMVELAGEGPLRGRALLAVHRFDEALAADPTLTESVALARHQGLADLVAKRRAAATEHPSTATWQALGDALAAAGQTREADRAYWESLLAYKDVSPLQVADIQFRRGLLWGESGEDPARARALYGDAVARLPGFVRAQVHLAELEWQAGEKSAAIHRVRPHADSEDPEPGGKLAVWLEGEEAAAWKQKTIQRYDALLARNPLAFADHAAEFYLAIGDLERARPLAKMNVDNRRTPRAIELCARASCEPAP